MRFVVPLLFARLALADTSAPTPTPSPPPRWCTEEPGFRAAGRVPVRDARGREVGRLTVTRGRLDWSVRSGEVLWTATVPARDGFDDSAAAVLAGDTLVVATFHRIATGSALRAFDARSGAPRWTGAVEQLRVAHSEYWNDVTLELRGREVVMRGREAGGCYEQVFDAATGARRTGWRRLAW